ncbi:MULTISPECIES: WXG100 family type VII secretion target [Streptomycetaceae]|uniref:Outer membrane channel protein CpnT-like N-terminal domain-containing protein n=1 Tax=Streptantibioticus cattleyicolor (strain ATCC 35852 / DSM 46488 / JCM 4925 / NBRC 14057 / NRRL 8057) TaxID=1003195 RepID=F8JZ30_STREN|nr:WXG100 family type VII secretion target [Streptantibioticus cattleyicolor]AEW94698.1 hypothetical protein SCATT_23270 [Streptantibioticus cattleyicolor NRRL 8057 = DSM 46488]MYS59330.1 hypothetical protein [Streptomyces sp. SID5468]CCB75052.1 protein of unknown function [Streptantibioticus cattleyicolor NRRL 8057 = DSM 46488]
MVDLNPLHWINKINESIGHSMADVLEFIGITNPAVDPDGIREVARHWKALGDALDDAHWHVGQALGGLRWEGKAAEAFHARAVEVREQCEKTAKACHDGHDQLNRFADQAHEMISEIGKLCAEILEFEVAALPLSLLTGPLAEVASNLAAGERAVRITALIARIAEAARTVDRAAEAILESLGTLGRAMKALTPIAKMAAGGAATTLGYDAIVNPDRLRHADTLEQDVEIGALLGIIGGGFGKGVQSALEGIGPRMVPALGRSGLLDDMGKRRAWKLFWSEDSKIAAPPAIPGDFELMTGDPVYFGKNSTTIGYDPKTLNNTVNIARIPRFHDVIVHGTDEGYYIAGRVNAAGKVLMDDHVSPAHIKEAILNNPNYDGGPVRLISCYSGRAKPGHLPLGQQLANDLGVPVRAPSDRIGTDPGLGPGQKPVIDRGGQWITFRPTGRP